VCLPAPPSQGALSLAPGLSLFSSFFFSTAVVTRLFSVSLSLVYSVLQSFFRPPRVIITSEVSWFFLRSKSFISLSPLSSPKLRIKPFLSTNSSPLGPLFSFARLLSRKGKRLPCRLPFDDRDSSLPVVVFMGLSHGLSLFPATSSEWYGLRFLSPQSISSS